MSENQEIAIINGVSAYQNQLLIGLTRYARLASWKLAILSRSHVFVGLPGRKIETVEGFDGRGAIYVGSPDLAQDFEIRRTLRRLDVPVVFAAPFMDGYEMPLVTSDERAVGRQMAEHLLETGLQQFGFLGFRKGCDYANLREKGFAETIRKRGLPCSLRPQDDMPWALDQGDPDCQKVTRWLKDLPKPIGIGCWYDGYAAVLIELAKRSDIRVPEEVVVVGVNDDPLCTARIPEISSVDLNLEAVGFRAAELLEECIAGKAPPQQPILIPPKGVVGRRSSKVTAMGDPLVAHCMLFIRDHVPEGLNVSRLLDEVHVSRSDLERRFKRALGYTPAVEIRNAQIETARQHLAEDDMAILEIAFACGFKSQSHFNQAFRRVMGQTPTAYRKQMRET